MQYWDADAIFDVNCPECGKQVEFYKDDTTRTCKGCGHRFVNPKMDFGCAAYCKYAEQCIGTLPEEFVGSQDNLLKDKVAVEMKRYYKTDFKRIGHVSRVARYAEKIGKDEGANLAIILCTAYLHNIGGHEVHDNQNGDDLELIRKKSLEIASAILAKLGAKEAVRHEVCSLLSDHEEDNSPESKALNDALLLARLEDQHKEGGLSSEQIEEVINTGFLTESGRQLARANLTHLRAI